MTPDRIESARQKLSKIQSDTDPDGSLEEIELVFDYLVQFHDNLQWRPIEELRGDQRTVLITSSSTLTVCHNYRPEIPKQKTMLLYKPSHFCEVPPGRP